MATKRTSKKKTSEEEAKTEVTAAEKTEAGAATGLGYSGKVTIRVVKGNKVIATQTNHNSGGSRLFEFFAKCLVGDYTSAQFMCPTQILLAHYSGTVAEAKLDPLNPSKCEKATARIIRQRAQSSTDGTVKKATLYFRVTGQMFTNIPADGVNELILYDEQASDNDYSAVYLITNPSAPTEWDPVAVTSNTTWYIDWELSVGNAST